MGNQYRFYLNGANKAKLIKFIVDNGFLVIDNHGNEVDCSLCNEETTFKQLFLYKPEFGKITFIGDKLRIDILTSPIIQLKLTYINDETRFVSHGRIWMSNPIVEKEYKNIKRYINTLTHKYHIGYKGCIYKCNMDEEIYNMIQNGYSFN